MTLTKRVPKTNDLLGNLTKKEYQRILPFMEETPLKLGETVYQVGELISDVYFPNSGIVSLLAGDPGRFTLEVGLVGKEGMVGLAVFMGVGTSRNHAVVQGEGVALRMKSATLRKECNNGSPLANVMRRYTHSLLTQITQSAVCNQFHSIEARLARWLLMTHDRMQEDEFPLTQEFLSHMLGVRREGVSRAASVLQKRKLIGYSRGTLKVLDRPGLEATSCGCYEIIRDEASLS
jgi:CRP-like cAMP-binding protein